MGKKGGEREAARKKFVQGAKDLHDIPESITQALWQTIEAFSVYGFNKSHAVSYSLISFQCAWLYNYFPAEWMASFLDKEPESRKAAAISLAEACLKLYLVLWLQDIMPILITTPWWQLFLHRWTSSHIKMAHLFSSLNDISHLLPRAIVSSMTSWSVFEKLRNLQGVIGWQRFLSLFCVSSWRLLIHACKAVINSLLFVLLRKESISFWIVHRGRLQLNVFILWDRHIHAVESVNGSIFLVSNAQGIAFAITIWFKFPLHSDFLSSLLLCLSEIVWHLRTILNS